MTLVYLFRYRLSIDYQANGYQKHFCTDTASETGTTLTAKLQACINFTFHQATRLLCYCPQYFTRNCYVYNIKSFKKRYYVNPFKSVDRFKNICKNILDRISSMLLVSKQINKCSLYDWAPYVHCAIALWVPKWLTPFI